MAAAIKHTKYAHTKTLQKPSGLPRGFFVRCNLLEITLIEVGF